jgi:transposase
MTQGKKDDSKQIILQEQGCLNRRSHRVTDPLFIAQEFFDPRDLVQVKYEMLRRVEAQKDPVTTASRAFGFSRPAFYQALSSFRREGLPGLTPRRRGPQGGHKLTAPIMEFLDEQLGADHSLHALALAKRVEKHFGVRVHPRSIERALARRQKKQCWPEDKR